MDTPVEAVPAPAITVTGPAAPSAAFVTGWGIIGIGTLLLFAAFFTSTRSGFAIDLGAGLVLVVGGWIMSRTRTASPTASIAAAEGLPAE